jgi:hypothetical protein
MVDAFRYRDAASELRDFHNDRARATRAAFGAIHRPDRSVKGFT